MSNVKKVTPGIELSLGGKTLTLVFDLWALASVERASGRTVPELLTSGSIDGVLRMLKAATLKHHPDLSEEDIGHMIDLGNLADVSEKLTNAFLEAAPAQAENVAGGTEKKADSQPTRGTG